MTRDKIEGAENADSVQVPQRWVDEVVIALAAATTIGKRSCLEGDHLHYANHDRLLREAGEQGYTIFVAEKDGGPSTADIMRRYVPAENDGGVPSPTEGIR